MKPLITLLLFILIIAEIYSVLPPQNEPFPLKPQNYVVGGTHIYSNLSEGSGSVAQIAEAAQEAGYDFIIITDTDKTEARKLGFEERMGKVDVFVEMEVAFTAGHALWFTSLSQLKDKTDKELISLAWQHYLGNRSDNKAFFVVAHPSHPKHPWTRLEKLPDGIEIVSLDTRFRKYWEESPFSFLTTLALYPFNNYSALTKFNDIYDKDFASWDAMNTLSPGKFALLGHDARARVKVTPQTDITWPSYATTFRTASQVFFVPSPLPQDFLQRKEVIYDAIRSGKSAIVFSLIHPFSGNHWQAKCGDKTYEVGATIGDTKSCEFLVQTPSPFPYAKVVKLYRNGEIIKTLETASETISIPFQDSGVYRVEVWAKIHSLLRILQDSESPYVIYNPIYVK